MKSTFAIIGIAIGAALFGVEMQQPVDISVPSGAIGYRNATTCPSGWTEQTQARGASVVGLVSGGTLNTTVGTVLTNQENRAVGQHAHTENAHNHGITDPGHVHTEAGWNGASGARTNDETGSAGQHSNVNTGTSTTGIMINNATPTNVNAGSVAGTNAPYIQLLICAKN